MSRRPLSCALGVLASLAAAASAGAQQRDTTQETTAVRPETRVRVEAATLRRPTVGVVARIDRDTLVLDDVGGHRRAVPIAAVRRVEVSAGRKGLLGSAARAAAWGATVGVVLFGGTYVLFEDESSGRELGPIMGGGAFGGAITGAIFGALFPGERWRPVALPR